MGVAPFQRRALLLRFDGHPEFDGLEVRCRRLSCNELFDLEEQRGAPRGTSREALEPLFDLLGGGDRPAVILEWNYHDHDGEYVPPTAAGLRSQDVALITAISSELLKAAAGVPAPLPQTSDGGQPSEEASLPMEPLSPSPGLQLEPA